jgi:tetratricopeptide (TPR) repeat protein
LKAAYEGRAAQAELGPGHPVTLLSAYNLAEAYRRRGKYDQAEPILKSVLRTRLAELGPKHPATLTSKVSLALLYHDQLRFDQAESLYREALEVQKDVLGPTHTETLTCEHNLGKLYLDEGKYDRAERLLGDVLEARTKQLGPTHPDTLVCKNNLGEVCRAIDKKERALTLFREAAEGVEERGFQQWNAKRIFDNLVACHEELLQYAQAEHWRRKWLAVVKERAGATSPTYAGQLAGLGWNLLRQQKGGEAEAVLRPCLAIRQEKQGDAWTTFETQAMLGATLLVQKKYAEAEPLLLQGFEGMKPRVMKTSSPEGRQSLARTLEWLVRLYEETGQKKRAEAWRTQLDSLRTPTTDARPPASGIDRSGGPD